MSKKWPPEIILVKWIDSMATTGWDLYKSRLESLKDEHLEHTSVGYLIKKTKQWVALTHSVGIGIHNCSDTLQIPMCAVIKISYLKAVP